MQPRCAEILDDWVHFRALSHCRKKFPQLHSADGCHRQYVEKTTRLSSHWAQQRRGDQVSESAADEGKIQ